MIATDMPEPIPNAPCMCPGFSAERHLCICTLTEKALRADITMTHEQREWAIEQIGSVEGYRREDYETASDADLCRGVLGAWIDYCRDKGLA